MIIFLFHLETQQRRYGPLVVNAGLSVAYRDDINLPVTAKGGQAGDELVINNLRPSNVRILFYYLDHAYKPDEDLF